MNYGNYDAARSAKDMPNATIAAGLASAFLDYALAEGASQSDLLSAAQLDIDELADQDHRIPASAYYEMIKKGMHLLDDTSLLLRFVLDTRLETMSIVGQIVHASKSFPHSLEQLNRYRRLMADMQIAYKHDRFEFHREGAEVWLIDHNLDDRNWMAIESSFARFISEFRRSAPEYPFELALDVKYSPPPHADRYNDLFRVPVRFNANRNALRINPIWLEVPFDGGKDYVFGVFTKHADALISELVVADSVRAKVETALLPVLHEGSISMDQMASNLGMSRQTLYRRLKGEGATFAQVHDQLRQRMAIDYLLAQKVSVAETAYLLGFSEASAFVRAFRRWTGSSPSQWKTLHWPSN